ncbi:MAG: hypothetical protein U0694_02455 [Anaerolineae bacterium]
MRAKHILLFIVSSVIAFFVFAGIALSIQATGLVSVGASNKPTAMSEIGAEEQAWLALGIDSYRIEISWSALPVMMGIVNTVVRDGEVVEQSCDRRYMYYCQAWIANGVFPHGFTIADLFTQAREAQARADNSPITGYAFFANIDFEPTYHFPTIIVSGIADPQVEDGAGVWEVVSFEPLP